MLKFTILSILFLFFVPPSFAFKIYHYDQNGERVYTTVDPKDYAKNKSKPKRAFVRQPRLNWDITDEMRAHNKRTTSDFTHRK